MMSIKKRKLASFYIFTAVLIVLVYSCKNNKSLTKSSDSNSFLITGKVSQTFSYCGGARPTQEILDRFATPKDYPNKIFYIRNGNKNDTIAKIVAKFITKEDGTFSFHLKPGTYSIILEEQLSIINASDYVTQNQIVDEKCLMEWWKKPYYILEVTDKDIFNLNFTFHHRCYIKSDIPCITYTGPKHP